MGVGDGGGWGVGVGACQQPKVFTHGIPSHCLHLATNAYRHAHSSHPHPYRVNIFVLTGAKTDCGEKR